MAVIEATRPAFWVQPVVSTQPSALNIQPLNHPILISVHLRKSAAKSFSAFLGVLCCNWSPVFSVPLCLRGGCFFANGGRP